MDEGDYGGGGGFANYANNAPPPLTAIDRFLCGQTQNGNNQNHEMINQPFVPWHGLPFLSNMCSSPYVPMARGFSVDNNGDVFTNNIGDCLTMEELKNYPGSNRNQESKRVSEREMIPIGSVKKFRGGAKPKVLIKGQWTDEEDSKLISLVNEFGDRKWALIAEKMAGRAGKQCRERWRNHLHPDIKKDTWSEEEVRMLISAHQKVGNKWAEIAKMIPGRTENSIKNQWNTTKRKQNSSRKNKTKDAKYKKPQSTLLQDYIRSKSSDHNLSALTSSTTTTKTATSDQTTENSTTVFPEHTNSYNNDSEPISLDISQSNDDEMSFMQALFQTTTTPASNESSGHVIKPKSPEISNVLGFSTLSSNLYDENSSMYFNNYLEDDMSNMHLDL